MSESKITSADYLSLIGARPGMTKIELCDRLDLPIDAVDDEIDDLLASLSIKSHMMTGKNGRPCIGYTLHGASLPTIFDRAMEAVSEEPAIKSSKPQSKVDKAIAFMMANGGSATSSELHAVMELTPGQYPSAWLADACKDGRVNKDGSNWAIGKGGVSIKVTDPMKPFTVVAPRDDTPVAKFDQPRDIEQAVVDEWDAAMVANDAMVRKAIDNPSTKYSGIDMDALHVKQSVPEMQVSEVAAMQEVKQVNLHTGMAWNTRINEDAITKECEVTTPGESGGVGAEIGNGANGSVRTDEEFYLEHFKRIFGDLNSKLEMLPPIIIRPTTPSFALWSDSGELHIAEGGETLLSLTREQVIALLDYLTVFDVTRVGGDHG